MVNKDTVVFWQLEIENNDNRQIESYATGSFQHNQSQHSPRGLIGSVSDFNTGVVSSQLDQSTSHSFTYCCIGEPT